MCLLLSFAILIFPVNVFSTVFSQDSSFIPNDQTINPGHIMYPLKRVWENLGKSLSLSDDSKFKFDYDLSDTRLSELNYVVNFNLENEIQRASERFAYQVGITTDYIITGNKDNLSGSIIEKHRLFKSNLESLLSKFPANSSYWLLIRQDMDTLDILTTKIRDKQINGVK